MNATTGVDSGGGRRRFEQDAAPRKTREQPYDELSSGAKMHRASREPISCSVSEPVRELAQSAPEISRRFLRSGDENRFAER